MLVTEQFIKVCIWPTVCTGCMTIKPAPQAERFVSSLFSTYGYTSHVSFCLSWWRYQMETFSALLAICAGNSPVTGEYPVQRPVTRSFDALFDLRLKKRLCKQWYSWWLDTPSHPLWCQCNVYISPLVSSKRIAIHLQFAKIPQYWKRGNVIWKIVQRV